MSIGGKICKQLSGKGEVSSSSVLSKISKDAKHFVFERHERVQTLKALTILIYM